MCACVRARVAPGRGAGGAEGCPNDTAAMVQGRQEGSQCRGSRRGLLPSAPGPCAPLPCSTGARQGRERSASGLQPPPGFSAMRQATGRAWGLAHIRLLEHVLHRLASLHADPRLPLALQQLAVVPAPRVGGACRRALTQHVPSYPPDSRGLPSSQRLSGCPLLAGAMFVSAWRSPPKAQVSSHLPRAKVPAQPAPSQAPGESAPLPTQPSLWPPTHRTYSSRNLLGYGS